MMIPINWGNNIENKVLGFPIIMIINDEDIVLNFCLILAKYFI